MDGSYKQPLRWQANTEKMRRSVLKAGDGQLELERLRLNQSAPDCVSNQTGGFVDIELVHKPRSV